MEIWKSIEGYEGRYEVSSLGRVRSLDRFLYGKNYKGKILKNILNKEGYHVVNLYLDGKSKSKFVHNLMCRTFIGPPPTNQHIPCHYDDVKTNNHMSNLYWGTHTENSLDKVRNGNHHGVNKVNCPKGHKLKKPNLRTDINARGCLACKKAQSVIKCSKWQNFSLQEVSDYFYRKIMRDVIE